MERVFFAPYDPINDIQREGSLLPPTPIHWHDEAGEFIGPHVYPVQQGATDLETGKRELIVDRSQPSPIRLFVSGSSYRLLGLIPANIHLFGTVGPGQLNLLGTDEQGRDQLSRLIFGGQVSLFIGLVGICISFPIGMLVGGYIGVCRGRCRYRDHAAD